MAVGELAIRPNRPSARFIAGATGTPSAMGEKLGSGRAFRGLFLVFPLSFLNLVGLILTVTALGGPEPWTRWQFIGLFGVIETASGLANIISPNVWRLPIAELQTSRRIEVKLATSALLLPHWGGLARFAPGAVAWRSQPGTWALARVALLVPFVLLLAWYRRRLRGRCPGGFARPELDVLQFVVRWAGAEKELTPISLTAATFQFLLMVVTIPAVKVLPPVGSLPAGDWPVRRRSFGPRPVLRPPGAHVRALVGPHRSGSAARTATRSRGAGLIAPRPGRKKSSVSGVFPNSGGGLCNGVPS